MHAIEGLAGAFPGLLLLQDGGVFDPLNSTLSRIGLALFPAGLALALLLWTISPKGLAGASSGVFRSVSAGGIVVVLAVPIYVMFTSWMGTPVGLSGNGAGGEGAQPTQTQPLFGDDPISQCSETLYNDLTPERQEDYRTWAGASPQDRKGKYGDFDLMTLARDQDAEEETDLVREFRACSSHMVAGPDVRPEGE